MKFEVINDKGKTIMFTTQIPAIPKQRQIELQFKAGYKFKLNGKTISKKALIDYIRENNVN